MSWYDFNYYYVAYDFVIFIYKVIDLTISIFNSIYKPLSNLIKFGNNKTNIDNPIP